MPELWRRLTEKQFAMIDLFAASLLTLAIREYVLPHITIAWR